MRDATTLDGSDSSHSHYRNSFNRFRLELCQIGGTSFSEGAVPAMKQIVVRFDERGLYVTMHL